VDALGVKCGTEGMARVGVFRRAGKIDGLGEGSARGGCCMIG
jgi:hypothetical protein